MPLKEYVCRDCDYIWEELIRKPEEEPNQCPRCELGKVELLISAHGGYAMSSGGGSTRPRHAGAYRGRKS